MKKLYLIGYIIFVSCLSFGGYLFFNQNWVYYRLAENHFKQNNYEIALDYYVKAIEKGIDPILVFENLAKSSIAFGKAPKTLSENNLKTPKDLLNISSFISYLGNTDKAIQILKELIKSHPNFTPAYFSLADLYLLQDEYLLSIRMDLTLLDFYQEKSTPSHGLPPIEQIYEKIGRSFFYKNDIPNAIHYYLLAKQNSASNKYNLLLANLYLKQHIYQKAYDLIKDISIKDFNGNSLLAYGQLAFLAHDYPKSLEIYEYILDINPQNNLARLQLAEIYYYLKEYPLSMKQFDILLTNHPNDPQIMRKVAILYIQLKDYQKAQILLENSLKKNPSSIVAKQFQCSNQKTKKILELLINRSYDFDPLIETLAIDDLKMPKTSHSSFILLTEDPALIKQFAINFEKDGKILEAIELYKKLVSLNPKANNYEKLGNLYVRIGKLNEAIAALEKAYEKDPSNQDYKRSYALALSYGKNDQRACCLLKELLEKFPNDPDIYLELSKIALRDFDPQKASNYINQALITSPSSPRLLLEKANLSAILGKPQIAIDAYKSIFKIFPENPYYSLQYANSARNWGDFTKSEKLYKEFIEKHPDVFSAYYSLSSLYRNMKLFECAKNEIEKVLALSSQAPPQALRELAEIFYEEAQYPQALDWIQKSLEEEPDNLQGLSLLAKIFSKQKNFEKALKIYQKIATIQGETEEAYIQIGLIHNKLNQKDEAKEYFSKAYEINPLDAAAQYFYLISLGIDHQKILEQALSLSEYNQLRFANLCIKYKKHDLSKKLLQSLYEKDPDNYLIMTSYVNYYSSRQNFSAANVILKKALKIYPNNYTLLLKLAENYSYNHQYDLSLNIYNQLIALNPCNPNLIIQAARVSGWNKSYLQAENYYKSLINSCLKNDFDKAISKAISSTELQTLLKNSSFKQIHCLLKDPSYEISFENSQKIRLIYLRYAPALYYKNYAEKELIAKKAYWKEHYLTAMNANKKLLKDIPYSQEALFDLSQCYCYLAQYQKTEDQYNKILNEFPDHSLAQKALNKLQYFKHRSLEGKYHFWEEKGYGELDRIIRQIYSLQYFHPINYKHEISATIKEWLEKPIFSGQYIIPNRVNKEETIPGNSLKLAYFGRLSPYWQVQASFEPKISYNKFPAKVFANIETTFHIEDFAKMTIGLEREPWMDNYYALKQGITLNSLYLASHSKIDQKIHLDLKARLGHYSDSNTLYTAGADMNLFLSTYPKILQATFAGEYRHTKKIDRYVLNGNTLENIIHPYWSPQAYQAYRFNLIWTHYLQKDHFCGSNKHYYQIGASASNDSEENKGYSFTGKWYYQWNNHWLFYIEGNLYNSKKWDAREVNIHLRYWF